VFLFEYELMMPSRTVARKFSVGGLCVSAGAGGLTF